MNTGYCNKKGFTLAEVFITLGIIGVVAAMTLPMLIQNYQKKVTVEKLKETYSILSQAIRQSEAENGELKYWNMAQSSDSMSGNYSDNKAFAEKYIIPYLKITKICRPKTTECWGNSYTYLNGSIDNYANGNTNNEYSVILANGVILGIWSRNSWTQLRLDLNGPNRPNISGKDVFQMTLHKSSASRGIKFYGFADGVGREYYKTSGYPCAKTGVFAGTYCGALIQVDGWQIKDDYPW